jgi:hypothetical protein
MAKTPRAPPVEPPNLSQYEDPWCIYATIAQAEHAIEDIIDVSMGFPKPGKNAGTGATVEGAPTITWFEPLEIAEGGWGFPAPPQQYLPSDPGEVLEYDPAWFPVDESGAPIPS